MKKISLIVVQNHFGNFTIRFLYDDVGPRQIIVASTNPKKRGVVNSTFWIPPRMLPLSNFILRIQMDMFYVPQKWYTHLHLTMRNKILKGFFSPLIHIFPAFSSSYHLVGDQFRLAPFESDLMIVSFFLEMSTTTHFSGEFFRIAP